MEEAKPSLTEKSDLTEEPNEIQAQTSEMRPAATNSNLVPGSIEDNVENAEQAGTSNEVTTNISETVAEKPTVKRNYRRRTEGSDDSSSNGEDEAPSGQEATVEVDEEAQAAQGSDSDDVSLDELHVSGSDAGNNQNLRSSTDSDDTDDSSFSFGSPLSPLLRFGLGNRRMFGEDDTDSNATSDEELVDKSKQQAREVMNKVEPLHNSLTWPRLLMNRESGFFCKRNETRYANHRKVFERTFYGSLNSVQRLELMAKLNEHLGCVNCLGFSKSGLYLLSGSDDLRVILWNWYNNKPLTMASSKHRKNIFQCKFYEEDGSNMKVISASADGSISLHQFSNDGGHTEKQVYTHRGAVHKIAVAENVVYSCGEDGLIIEFDLRSKTPSKMITVREKHRKIPLFSISAHPNETKYAVCGRDQYLRVYDRRNQKIVLSRHCPTELLEKKTTVRYISSCVYNYNGSELLGSFNDESIYLFDPNNHIIGTYMHKYQGHVNSATIKGVNFYGPKSEFIVSGSDCSNIFFWHKGTESIVQWMRGDENGIVNVLEPHPIYPILATSGLDKDIKIWMPSNEDFKLKKDELAKCVLDNMKNQMEASQSATFSLDPAIIQLARRFFQRQQRDTASPNPLNFDYQSSEEDSSS